MIQVTVKNSICKSARYVRERLELYLKSWVLPKLDEVLIVFLITKSIFEQETGEFERITRICFAHN